MTAVYAVGTLLVLAFVGNQNVRAQDLPTCRERQLNGEMLENAASCAQGGRSITGEGYTCNLPEGLPDCQSGASYNLYRACSSCIEVGTTKIDCGQVLGVVRNICVKTVDGASINGDPHFTGFDGTRFDFLGEKDKVFNVISEQLHQVNALFGTLQEINGTQEGLWLMGFGVQYGNMTLTVKIDVPEEQVPHVYRDEAARHDTKMRMELPSGQWLKVELDGVDISDSVYSAGKHQNIHGDIVLYFPGSNITNPHDARDGPVVVLRTPDLEMTFYVETEDVIHLDIGLEILSDRITAMHGVLGQTVHWVDGGKEKVIEGSDADYLVDGLLGNNCKYNLFGRTVESAGKGRMLPSRRVSHLRATSKTFVAVSSV